MVELNRVDEVQRFRTYKIYGKHHLPHKGEHKLVATIHMHTGDNSLADCENLPVLFMNAQTYRDDAMRLRSELEQKEREISRLQADGRKIAELEAENAKLKALVRGWHYLAVGPDEMGDYYTHKQLVKASEPYASPALGALGDK